MILSNNMVIKDRQCHHLQDSNHLVETMVAIEMDLIQREMIIMNNIMDTTMAMIDITVIVCEVGEEVVCMTIGLNLKQLHLLEEMIY